MSREEMEFMKKVEEKAFSKYCDEIEMDFSNKFKEMQNLVVENSNIDRDLADLDLRIRQLVRKGENFDNEVALYNKMKRDAQVNGNIILDKIDELSVLNVALKYKGCKLARY